MSVCTPAAICRSAKAPAMLVSNLTNIRYLSGVSVSAGFVLVKAKKIILFVDGRYEEAAKKQARTGVLVEPVATVEKYMKQVTKCAFESQDVTVDRFGNWKRKFKNTKFVQSKGVIEEFRRAKTAEELKNFRKAQRITQQIMKKLPGVLKPGVTEKVVARQIMEWAGEVSFDPIVAFGTHSSRPHHHPTDRKLKAKDIVQIDCGARVNGYCADQSRVFFLGKPTIEQQRVYSAVERAKTNSMQAVKAGVTNHKLDQIARSVLEEEDLEQYFTHSLGHGVGLDIHEGPSLSQNAPKTKLKKYEIVTIEPGVYIPGKFGIRLEDEVIVM